MSLKLLKNKLGTKYNIILIILSWFIFAIAHILYFGSFINSFSKDMKSGFYIFFLPIFYAMAVFFLADIKEKRDKKIFIYFGLMPLIFYYICLGLFIYFIIKAFENFGF